MLNRLYISKSILKSKRGVRKRPTILDGRLARTVGKLFYVNLRLQMLFGGQISYTLGFRTPE
jgi:hypothetical protein